ncbi:MAG: prolipoprotein diacylglyceryl transferase family protein, partial [Myxococcota bacterium]|nr:prolipoprotein diacylglyceryl transferase family protein [Myxococcota bacterium]
GEVFGRVTDASVPWAMRFPTDPAALAALGLERGGAARVYAAAEVARAEGLWEGIIAQAPLRHPSQLYEAFGEGVVPLVLLWALVVVGRRKQWHLPRGAFLATFMVLYGLGRVVCEFFREPQIAFGPVTMGMVLCVAMMVVSAVMLRWPYRGGRTPALAWPLRPDAEPMVDEALEKSGGDTSKGSGTANSSRKKRKKRKKNR